jgi:hypothetical protein
MGSSKLLIDEPPLQVLPGLAVLLGLNEAIVLQQIHYWLQIQERSKNTVMFHDGFWWVRNSYEQWRTDNFPFWSTDTIYRAVRSLEDKGILLSMQAPGSEKHYTIDYTGLRNLRTGSPQIAEGVSATCVGSTREPTIETTQETTETTTTTVVASPPRVAIQMGAGDLPEPERVPLSEDGDELQNGKLAIPKALLPDPGFQTEFLAVCRASYFEPGQKAKVKGISNALRAGSVLAGVSLYEKTLDALKSGSDKDVPKIMPESWYEWRVREAKQYHWNRWGLINALMDRTKLAQHCNVKLQELGGAGGKKRPGGSSGAASVESSADAEEYIKQLERRQGQKRA